MASSSTPSVRDHASGRLKRAASTLAEDTQSLVSEIKKAFTMVKNIAVDLEREKESTKVKELETLAVQLSESCDNCIRHASAIHTVGNEYQPTSEFTDFKKLLDEQFMKLKAMPSQNDRLIRQFQEAVWNVHHKGQPMPGEEEEDIVMTSTQSNLLNVKCPLSGKMITDLAEPVRRCCTVLSFVGHPFQSKVFAITIFLLCSMDCKHIYEKEAVIAYLPQNGNKKQCCIAGCPKFLQAHRLVCDPFLLTEIDELRSMNQQTEQAQNVEDFTGLDDED
ncbi:unnamed protein product [Linum tenue]|uniref:SP-RING-type domain-containing protein n=1 Tax=Linum tenue TaxID=586396 RepID=A0AAV0JKC1_9ROSI|nr:unnamed protein product [Linum tenue]